MSDAAGRSAGEAAGDAAGDVAGELGRARAAEALLRAQEAGIHRLSIPTPFPVGRVNAYLVEGEPLTLIDSGPNSAKALDEMERALGGLGHAIEEIGLLAITHGHADHVGLADVLQRRSGAAVAALAGLDRQLGDAQREGSADEHFIQRMMRENGVPREVVCALRATSAGIRAWSSSVSVDRVLSEGDELRLGGHTFGVLHRPGHSPADTVFLEEGAGLMVAGDHLLAHISSNPLMARPLGCRGEYEGRREPALMTYIESLRRTREMELATVLPGHGEPITDHRALIDARLALHERRAARIETLISRGWRSAHEIAMEMWGELALTQAYLTLSEVLGHVDLLLAERRAQEDWQDGVARYRAG